MGRLSWSNFFDSFLLLRESFNIRSCEFLLKFKICTKTIVIIIFELYLNFVLSQQINYSFQMLLVK